MYVTLGIIQSTLDTRVFLFFYPLINITDYTHHYHRLPRSFSRKTQERRVFGEQGFLATLQ